jgi:hypothetical protein
LRPNRFIRESRALDTQGAVHGYPTSIPETTRRANQ